MSDIKVTHKVSKMFSTARIYCLISIVSAHLYFTDAFLSGFFARLGTVGVVLFLLMAGYFFKPAKFEGFPSLIKNKFFSVCIPWIFLGSLTWLYKAILSSQFRSVGGYLGWILGNGSYLYYLPVLILCFLILYRAPRWVVYASLPVTAASILLTAAGILAPVYAFVGINSYLNIFNWIGFFALGMILQRVDQEKLYFFFRKFGLLNISLFTISFILLLVFKNVKYDYFSYIAIPYELLGCAAILSLSTLSLTKFSFFGNLSNLSFGIYLIHMIFIGLLDKVVNVSVITGFLAPIIIILASFTVLLAGLLISKKIRLEKIYVILTGVRTSK